MRALIVLLLLHLICGATGTGWASFGFDSQNTGLRVGSTVEAACLAQVKYGVDIDLAIGPGKV